MSRGCDFHIGRFPVVAPRGFGNCLNYVYNYSQRSTEIKVNFAG
jgi:hypothetical protein